MKLMTILCSSDLESIVEGALIAAGLEGFVTIPNAVGVKRDATPAYSDPPRWAAAMYVAPAPEGAVARIVENLRAHAGRCDVEPCLRIIVSPVDQVI